MRLNFSLHLRQESRRQKVRGIALNKPFLIKRRIAYFDFLGAK